MVAARHLILPCVLPLSLLACASTNSKLRDQITPGARSITIYSNGGSVVSGTLDPAVLGKKRLRLPSTARGIKLSQDGESLKWFTVQTIHEPKNEATSPDDSYVLVGFPSLSSGELSFVYELPEITWMLDLEASIIDAKSLALRLQAVINIGASQALENCNVVLVLNNAVSVEKISGATFNLSAFDLYPQRNITFNLDRKTLDYSFIREWYTYVGKDDVHVRIQVKNPFSVDLNRTDFSVEANQIGIESGSIQNQVRPGEILSLGAGIDDTIDTFRWIKVTEDQSKKPLPFNHKVQYRVTNRSDQEKTLRLVSLRVSGSEHRSVYHFKRPPDATPEDTIVWLLTLKPGSTETLEYDYDADIKDVDGENGFEAAGE